jgi:hypothetical protein
VSRFFFSAHSERVGESIVYRTDPLKTVWYCFYFYSEKVSYTHAELVTTNTPVQKCRI